MTARNDTGAGPSGRAVRWAPIVELAWTARLILRVAIRRRLQFFSDAKVPNDKLVDFESPDSCATDRQPTNSESADGQRSNRDRGKR